MTEFTGTHDEMEVALKEALVEVDRLNRIISEYIRSLDETRFPIPTTMENNRWVAALRVLRETHLESTDEYILMARP